MNRRSRLLNRKMDAILERDIKNSYKSPWIKNRAVRKMLSNPLSVFGIVAVGTLIILSFSAPLIAPYSPLTMDLSHGLQGPSWQHWLGTDKIGRDVLSRILYGGQVSILVGLGSALGSALIGVALGVYSGYRGGWLDWVVFRASEVFMAFPQIILVLMLVSMTGQSVGNLIFLFMVTGWGSMYRMTRSQVLSIRQEEYVTALQAFGINRVVIGFKHILPNALGPITVNITLSTAMFILQESSLSFLGLGVPLETPTWGNILNVANDLNVLKDAPWIWLPVGIVLALFVLGINFIGDGLRDSTDPTQQG